jgi:UDP-N-acetylmuramate dehydrogenase
LNLKNGDNQEMEIYYKLAQLLGAKDVLRDEPLNKHTTYKIGGVTDYFVTPRDIKSLRMTMSLCREYNLPYYIIGNGSNLLVGDKGFKGVMIQIFHNISEVKVEGNRLYVEAGALLSKIANIALNYSLKGLEFASGIPGTFGGAVMMNAGAYGGEMKDVIESVRVIDEVGEIKTLKLEELELGYRTSILMKRSYIIVDGVLRLEEGNYQEIVDVMEDYQERRNSKQPLEWPSAGSTFKRPEGYYAGKLIADAGLAGFQVGGAKVSEKHCGFVVNTGAATASDVVSLMEQVSHIVEEKYGVKLEPEVKFVGEF